MRENPERQLTKSSEIASARLTAHQSIFNLHHPVVPFVYFAAAIVFGMSAFHPVYLGVSFCSACALSVLYRGARATGKTLAWQIPLICIIALVNPLISLSGSTELFRIGLRPVYWESFAYGLCMGMMLSLTMLWLSNASHVLTSDKVMSLAGNALPTVTLMTSMALRLVPQFVRRGTYIDEARSACLGASEATSKREKLRRRTRQMSVLMGWSMEDSLETADAMRARGWGAARRRTAYERQRFCKRDAIALACLIALAAASVVGAVAACSAWQFYPAMPVVELNWGFAAYVALLAFPLVLRLAEDTRWVR